MRKLKLFGLLFCLLVSVNPIFGQGEIGVVGFMSGQVTRSDGRGLGGVTVTASPSGFCFEWEGNTTRTNPFGYYRLLVHYDCQLIVIASRKGMVFTPSVMFIPIDGNYQNINFVANQ